jgi:hypothetical protein
VSWPIGRLGGAVLVVPTLGCQAPIIRSCSSDMTRVIASADGQTGRLWPNEPAGFKVLSDEPFNALSENGWRFVQRETLNGSGIFVVTDSTAPLSPPHVLQFTYADGFVAGREPGAEFYDPATPTTETYFGLWWKPSRPWQNHAGSGVNKIAFLYGLGGSGDMALIMFNTGSTYTMQVVPEFPVSGDVRRLAPNVTATAVVLGVWHRIEWYVKTSTSGTSRDGVSQWWLDGVLQGKYGDLQMPAAARFSEYQIAPTWGGVGGTKVETDCFWYDHAHISAEP